eukprot:CAMPEP_0177607704 /NCGR_PEP_ID=MMETSP0419_2-20121207/18064_1 /TAXON_ID=582737 /ORGANISM="Tetraselmis sp., Strain GSL018" /LENGTH=32 /DNA_ID= /DNA_START= /DNA_END= /DNA_ORIENTATION=
MDSVLNDLFSSHLRGPFATAEGSQPFGCPAYE